MFELRHEGQGGVSQAMRCEWVLGTMTERNVAEPESGEGGIERGGRRQRLA